MLNPATTKNGSKGCENNTKMFFFKAKQNCLDCFSGCFLVAFVGNFAGVLISVFGGAVAWPWGSRGTPSPLSTPDVAMAQFGTGMYGQQRWRIVRNWG